MNRRQRRATAKHNEVFNRRLRKRTPLTLKTRQAYSKEEAEELHRQVVKLLKQLEREGASEAARVGWSSAQMVRFKDDFISEAMKGRAG